jgi:hypothetical protein
MEGQAGKGFTGLPYAIIALTMKEGVLRDLLSGNLVKLVAGGLQGVYPEPFTGRTLKTEDSFAVQAPLVLTQLTLSPGAQILSFFIMESDSMVRAGRALFPGTSREESLKLAVSANAEVLNFVSSRMAWLLAKLEGIPGAEITPPRVGHFTATQAYRIRPDEGAFFEFLCSSQNLAFRFAAMVQCL